MNSKHHHHGLWSHTGYPAWFAADTASAAGLSLRLLAISLAGYLVSGSTAKAGWVGTACLVCQQVAAVFGGTFIDRHDRRRLVIVNAVCGAVAWGSVGLLMALGRMTYLLFLVICAAASGVNGFLSGATDALLRSIVPIGDYPQARSLNEGRDAAISMAGGPVSGFLYALAPFVPFAASALLYALSGASACLLPRMPRSAGESAEDRSLIDRRSTEHPHPDGERGQKVSDGSDSGQKPPSFWHDLAEGWRWVFTRPLLMRILVCMMLLNFSVNGIQYAIQLMLISQKASSQLIGFLDFGISAGMVVGAVVAGKISKRVAVGPSVCLGVVFCSLVCVPLLFDHSYPVIMVFYSLLGLPVPLLNALLLGFIYAKTPAGMQGRALSALSVPAQALSSFCSAIAGSLLPLWGFDGTLGFFLLMGAVSAVLILTSTKIRAIPAADGWEKAVL